MLKDLINRITEMGMEDGGLDVILIEKSSNKLTIMDFFADLGDDESNASNASFKYNNSYQWRFEEELKQETRFMETVQDEQCHPYQQEKRGDYICHEEQHDQFQRTHNNNDNLSDDNDEQDDQIDDKLSSEISSIQPDPDETTKETEVLQELRSKLDGPFWTGFLYSTSDTYWTTSGGMIMTL